MRALILAAALMCAAGSAAAQPDQNTADRGDVAGVFVPPPAPDVAAFQNVCIGSEVVPAPRTFFPPAGGAYQHSFYFTEGGAFYRIDVTSTGLRVLSATESAPLIGSPQADTRFNTLIETLRAAAASRSSVRIDHNNSRVTQVIVLWTSRCP